MTEEEKDPPRDEPSVLTPSSVIDGSSPDGERWDSMLVGRLGL